MQLKYSALVFAFAIFSPIEQLNAKEPSQAARPAIVSAAHKDAVAAGMEILERGGDAADAAVAIQAMLGLVEPQSSGIGGGAFMLRYDAKSKTIAVYDGREAAPRSADPRMFLDANGAPISRRETMVSGRATGIPGVIAMLHMAQSEHGKLPWNSLFETAALRAQNGFVVSPRLGRFVRGPFPQNQMPDVKAYFTKPDGQLISEGDILRNPEYANTLRRIARIGPRAFYRGQVAAAMRAKLAAPPMGTVVTQSDFTNYRAIKRQPICAFIVRYNVCTAPPPSSGVSLLQLLLILQQTNIAELGPDSPLSWFLFAEASRLMYADRDAWIGDPRFVDNPISGLLDKGYIANRRTMIGDKPTIAIAGEPKGAKLKTSDKTIETGGTSHFVVHDNYGNIVSMTTTVESFFGSGRMVHGFFLNNQMTDFSAIPEGPNAIAPYKRPRSSMSPVIILDQDMNALGAIGSPGGSAIIAYVAKSLIGIINWDMKMQAAFDLPNIVARGNQYNGETSQMPQRMRDELLARGINIRSGSGEDSGLHGFIWRSNAWDAGADKRRDGTIAISNLRQNQKN